MPSNSAIEWTGATWNPVVGCTRVDPACGHCYIVRQTPMRIAGMKFEQVGQESTTGIVLHPERLDAEKVRRLTPRDKPIFVCSMSDLFHEEIEVEYIARIFAVMSLCKDRTFQVLTKRIERARDLLRDEDWSFRAMMDDHRGASAGDFGWPLPNVWVGTTIGNSRYTYRADVLREVPAVVRFISAEPLLGSLFAGGVIRGATPCEESLRRPLDLTGIDWVIVGGESGGRDARPMHRDWARELRDACLGSDLSDVEVDARYGPEAIMHRDLNRVGSARPAFFFKQWGSYAYCTWDDAEFVLDTTGRRHRLTLDAGPLDMALMPVPMRYAGASPKSGGRLLDGREWNEMPEHVLEGARA